MRQQKVTFDVEFYTFYVTEFLHCYLLLQYSRLININKTHVIDSNNHEKATTRGLKSYSSKLSQNHMSRAHFQKYITI